MLRQLSETIILGENRPLYDLSGWLMGFWSSEEYQSTTYALVVNWALPTKNYGTIRIILASGVACASSMQVTQNCRNETLKANARRRHGSGLGPGHLLLNYYGQ